MGKCHVSILFMGYGLMIPSGLISDKKSEKKSEGFSCGPMEHFSFLWADFVL
jgi:hypothetical protein